MKLKVVVNRDIYMKEDLSSCSFFFCITLAKCVLSVSGIISYNSFIMINTAWRNFYCLKASRRPPVAGF